MPPGALSSDIVSVVSAVAMTAPKPSPSTTNETVGAQVAPGREVRAGGRALLGARTGRVRGWATTMTRKISRHPVAWVKGQKTYVAPAGAKPSRAAPP